MEGGRTLGMEGSRIYFIRGSLETRAWGNSSWATSLEGSATPGRKWVEVGKGREQRKRRARMRAHYFMSQHLVPIAIDWLLSLTGSLLRGWMNYFEHGQSLGSDRPWAEKRRGRDESLTTDSCYPVNRGSLHKVLTATFSDLFRPPACHFQGPRGASGPVEQAWAEAQGVLCLHKFGQSLHSWTATESASQNRWSSSRQGEAGKPEMSPKRHVTEIPRVTSEGRYLAVSNPAEVKLYKNWELSVWYGMKVDICGSWRELSQWNGFDGADIQAREWEWERGGSEFRTTHSRSLPQRVGDRRRDMEEWDWGKAFLNMVQMNT